MFSLGWYRASGEGCGPRRQRPQPAQYSGHHHCEQRLFCSLICSCHLSPRFIFPLMLLLFRANSFCASCLTQTVFIHTTHTPLCPPLHLDMISSGILCLVSISYAVVLSFDPQFKLHLLEFLRCQQFILFS